MRVVKHEEGLPLLKMIVYGPPGSGKTPFCTSFNRDQRTAPMLLVDMAGRPETSLAYDPSLRVVALDKVTDINIIYSFFFMGQPDDHPFRTFMAEAGQPLPAGEKFKTIALDTYTAYQLYEIGYLLADQEEVSVHKNLNQIPSPSDIRHWGIIAPNTIVPASAFCELPVNVLFTLQEYTQTDIKKQTTRRKPQLSGQAADIVPAYFNMSAILTWATPPKEIDTNQRATIMMTWRLDSERGYAKQDWMRGPNVVDGMWLPDPSKGATKLFDLAEKYYQEFQAGNLTK